MAALSGDEKGLLIDLSQHDGFRVLAKAIDALAGDQERLVANTKITVGRETEVLYAKARAEGARKLQEDLARVIQKLRSKK